MEGQGDSCCFYLVMSKVIAVREMERVVAGIWLPVNASNDIFGLRVTVPPAGTEMPVLPP